MADRSYIDDKAAKAIVLTNLAYYGLSTLEKLLGYLGWDDNPKNNERLIKIMGDLADNDLVTSFTRKGYALVPPLGKI